VIFGAQDPLLGNGSARLFALDAMHGTEIWKSDPIAEINGNHGVARFANSTSDPVKYYADLQYYFDTFPKELHQRMALSSPLIFNNKAYFGIHDFGDSPIQTGRVIAVDLSNGHIDPSFHFQAVGTSSSPLDVRGGGIWNALTADSAGVYFTTGNTRIPSCAWPYKQGSPTCLGPLKPEPSPNYGLSMIRLDKDTGNVIWSFKAVPFDRDYDPDWAAGATVMSTSCGELIASVQKDGWSYAVDASNGSMRWQFPPTGLKSDEFLNAVHGNDDYRRPGAAWNDVFIVRTGGETVARPGEAAAGYTKLHALNACATAEKDRVRWIAVLPPPLKPGDLSEPGVVPPGNLAPGVYYHLFSAPTVTGGFVFVGTDTGHLIVLADPTIVPTQRVMCSNVDYAYKDCSSPYALVPSLLPVQDIEMPDHGSLAAMRNEPVLARGKVFVATDVTIGQDRGTPSCWAEGKCHHEGHVYMLATSATDVQICIAQCDHMLEQCMESAHTVPDRARCGTQWGAACKSHC
jgi:outer membrane protein assembly factor BamB